MLAIMLTKSEFQNTYTIRFPLESLGHALPHSLPPSPIKVVMVPLRDSGSEGEERVSIHKLIDLYAEENSLGGK